MQEIPKLSVIVRLLHVKSTGEWSDKSFNMLLELLREVFPTTFSDLLKNTYESNKLMKQLGTSYEKIDAYPNHCVIYWDDKKSWKECKTCNHSRQQPSEKDSTSEKRKVPYKVLWHFHLKPRL